ncbi:MAG: potassium transporter, partial [Deltaproteobacteria bacterium]
GASPGSCGGGIKTTNLAILFSLGYNRLMGRTEAVIFRRTVPRETVARSMALLIGSFLFLTFMLLFFLVSEESGVPHKEGLFLEILFELTSAFGTVGLSAGMTSRLDALGKVLVAVTMFVGRLGLLTMAFALAKRKEAKILYAEEDIMVG